MHFLVSVRGCCDLVNGRVGMLFGRTLAGEVDGVIPRGFANARSSIRTGQRTGNFGEASADVDAELAVDARLEALSRAVSHRSLDCTGASMS